MFLYCSFCVPINKSARLLMAIKELILFKIYLKQVLYISACSAGVMRLFPVTRGDGEYGTRISIPRPLCKKCPSIILSLLLFGSAKIKSFCRKYVFRSPKAPITSPLLVRISRWTYSCLSKSEKISINLIGNKFSSVEKLFFL